jgi:hypothetical protein
MKVILQSKSFHEGGERMDEGTIELIMNNPTAGGTNGQVVSESTQQFPINVIVNTKYANFTIVKMALRCTEGHQTTGTTLVSFSGATASMWGVAPDDSYVDEAAAEEATFTESLQISSVIGDTNHIIWFKVSTDGTEDAMVDTSVVVNVYGHVVPVPSS